MAITVNPITGVISVPKNDMALIQASPTEIRELNLNDFRLTLRDLEDDIPMRPWPRTHDHNADVEVGGVTLADVLIILEPYTLTFEDGQYAVNLVGANSNVGDRINLNQVSVRSFNSAGLVNSRAMEYSSYGGVISVDITSPYFGTAYPVGTPQQPVNNMEDAHLIAQTIGENSFLILSDMTVTSIDLSDGHKFIGGSPFIIVTLDASANLLNCAFEDMCIVGEMDGVNSVIDCYIGAITDVSGVFKNCAFESTIELNGPIDIFDSYSRIEGPGYPIFTVGAQHLTARNFRGSFGLAGALVGHLSSIGVQGGRMIVEPSCIGGDVHVRGTPFEILDNSGVSCNVLIETSEGGGGWDDILADHNTAGTFGGAVNSLGYMDHMVYINTENVAAGNGTQNAPFNTLTAAIDFAESKNIRHLIVQADIVIDRQLKTFKVTGVGNPTIDCNGQNLTGCEFWHCAMEGSYIGAITVQESILLDGFWLNGFFEKCALNGDLFCTDLGQVNLVKCISNIAGLGRPTISMNAIGTCLLSIRGFNGGMTIKHCNAVTDAVTVEISEGALAFDSTNTDGVMVARGFCVFDDTTTGAAVHDQTALPANIQAMLDLMEADEEHTPTSIIKRRKGTIDNLLVKNVAGSNLSKTLTVTQP